jgi:basic membrane protein A
LSSIIIVRVFVYLQLVEQGVIVTQMKSKRLVLFIVFALILTACGGGSEDSVDEVVADEPAETLDAPATTAAAPEPEEPAAKVCLVLDIGGLGDQGFNDMAYDGYQKALADFNVEGTFLEPDEGGENRGELLDLCAADGNDLVIGNGFLFAGAITETAANYPDVNFAITDETFVEGENIRSMVFAEEQGSYLVGVAAALQTETGIVGFVGGVDIPLIHAFEAGFLQGVKSVDPNITIISKYASVPPDFSGFNDPVKGKEIALAMYEEGADVVYHAAGGTGIGVCQATAEHSSASGEKDWCIGVDTDQITTIGSAFPETKEYFLSSMLKQVDVAVYNAIKDTVNGEFGSGSDGGPNVIRENLASGGIDISYTGGYIDGIKDSIEAAREEIISGAVTVSRERP